MRRPCIMWVLWPSFLAAGVGSAMFFALVDPLDILVFGMVEVGRNTAYAAGFFLFWMVTALSSGLSLYLSSTRCRDDWIGD